MATWEAGRHATARWPAQTRSGLPGQGV